MEQSILSDTISTAIKVSLQYELDDPHSKFSTISRLVKTIPNNGVIIGDDGLIYTNKCIIKSFYQGLQKYKKYFLNLWNSDVKITETLLLILSGFLHRTDMFDTDNPDHIKYFKTLMTYFPQIKVHVYIGSNINDEWFISPHRYEVFGTGELIIRILNKNMIHFELIDNEDLAWEAYDRTVQNEHGVFIKQNNLIRLQQQRNRDMKYAKILQEEEDRKFALFIASKEM